jgi:putative ABC transport system ATP-binding protein
MSHALTEGAQSASNSPSQRPGLHVDGLSGSGRGPFSLEVRAGQCALLTGPSGVGKSLLLRMIADLDPNQGSVWLDGVSRDAFSGPAWRRQVLYVAAESGWWDDMVVSHFTDVIEAEAMLALLRLPPGILRAPVSQLSTGERQRLALIRALSRRPRFMLLDEPTSGLDSETTLAVEALLVARKASGLGFLMVSHQPEQAARMRDTHYRIGPDGLFALP